ncbi:efflux RND transporter periplasmic adaptor subunit [Pedobacter deserti]|uniref:efflux RND transporter periplasmic adaptor subunit n=1 Tax=Pedobacter deserti TaxID=2817382 RepID=UPI00210BC124|nr:efflux RND transporter periplasmic adaptor subunit [Pedobacter sp. SYSU D00382]
MKKLNFCLSLSIPALLLLASCGNSGQDKGDAKAGSLPSYPVFSVEAKSTSLETEYPATLEGVQNVDIRAKVDGFIDKIYIDEGATVKKGQLLFSINAPQYEQIVRTAGAAISSAEADVNAAQLQVNKTKPLVEKDIISKYDLEAAQLTLQSRRAALAQAKAELANAKTNLSYTKILSPVSGVVGSIPFKEGSLVGPSNSQPLTTVSDISRIYAYFSMNEKQLLDFTRDTKGTSVESKIKSIPPVTLTLADGTTFPETGKIESINGLINTGTGSASLRATFSNQAMLLKTGASASVRIPKHLENAILVPQKSTMDLQGKKFVYLVDAKGTVTQTEIEIMEVTSGDFYVVTKGLKPGDHLVLEGFQSLKNGAQIKPEMQNSDVVYTGI